MSHEAEFLIECAEDRERENAKILVAQRTDVMKEQTGKGMHLAEANLSGLDLSGFDLSGANLNRAVLASTDLSEADLSGASLICPIMERTTLRNAILKGFYGHAMSYVSSDASGADMSDAIDVTGALFHGVQLVGANLRNGNFAGSTFYQCDLTAADLSGAILQGCVFNECILREAVFDNAKLADVTFIRSHADDASFETAAGEGIRFQHMTGFSNVRMVGAKLPGLEIRRCHVDHCTFLDADLERASFTDCSIESTDFSRSLLCGARFDSCHGAGVVLALVDISDATFRSCSFPGVDFQYAFAENTRLLRCTMTAGVFAWLRGRGFTVRDSDLLGANFSHAYLYRAIFTGDPVHGMMLDTATFEGANLIQATFAASMKAAKMTGAMAAYARLNQTDFTGADLGGFGHYKASTVKTRLDAHSPLPGALVEQKLQSVRGST